MENPSSFILFTSLLLLITPSGVLGTTFNFVNKCDYTVWPGVLGNAGSGSLDTTGFELPKGTSRSFLAPTGWSGRFWGRTGCKFDGSGSGSCLTGDCGSGQLECNGAGASPPVTLAEFTIGSTGGQDFYDVSLVDGYNIPMIVEGTGGSGQCESTGCTSDLNQQCPEELRVGDGHACKSACEAFNSPEYCCSGAYSSPATCRPSMYSQMFKAACPRSYSYAYDDATSTFTCTGADYTVTFCPSSPSQKSSQDSIPMTSTPTPPTTTQGSSSSSGLGSGPGSGSGSSYGFTYGYGATPTGVATTTGTDMGTGMESGTGYMVEGSGSGSGAGSGEAMLADGSYMAGLAMGDSPSSLLLSSSLQSALLYIFCFLIILFFI